MTIESRAMSRLPEGYVNPMSQTYGSDKDLEDRVARRVASEVVRAVELGV